MARLAILQVASPAEWEAYLEREHAQSPGAWLKIAKKGVAGISYPQALEIALCFGWIDGQKDKHDAQFWLQRFTPRKQGSRWSKINCEKVTALLAAGRVRPAGLHQIEQAKSDGRWQSAYASQSKAQVPEDLERALKKNPRAQSFFQGLDSANRYAVLYRVHHASTPERRAERIQKFVQMLSDGETFHPPRKKRGTDGGSRPQALTARSRRSRTR